MLSIGIDLAQSRDRTAIVALASERMEASDEEALAAQDFAAVANGGRWRRPRTQLHHWLVHLDTMPPGASYPVQADRIARTARVLAEEWGRPSLYVDATGVGRPVVDVLRQACEFPIVAVTITGGGESTTKGRAISVGKADLVGTLEVALSTRRLHADPELTLAKDLDKELRAFSYDLSATGRPLYRGRGAHDDLVLALCLALYGADRGATGGSGFVEFLRRDIAAREAASGIPAFRQ